MAHKPSDRRNYRESQMDLNLTPMMNLIAILIPVLLVSMVFVEIASVDVALAGQGPARTPTPPTDSVPLQLRVVVGHDGYELSGAFDLDEPSIPAVRRKVGCERFVGTTPPPRRRNLEEPTCRSSDDGHNYWVYDRETLRSRLLALKATHPQERSMTVSAEDGVELEALTDLMDTVRDYEDANGRRRPLFDEIVVDPDRRR